MGARRHYVEEKKEPERACSSRWAHRHRIRCPNIIRLVHLLSHVSLSSAPLIVLSCVSSEKMMTALRKNSSAEDTFLPSSSPSGLKKHRKKKKSIAEAQSNPVFVISAEPSGPSPSTSPKPHKRKKRSWRGESAARKLSEALPAALRSPTQILKRTKKPLGPSLSWDPEHRSRSPSMTRSRVHSDGSSETGVVVDGKKEEEDGGIVEEPRFELELTCVHCAMAAEYRRRMLKVG